jgi:N-acetyl sugar amidotransferase
MELSNMNQKNWEHYKLKDGEKIFLCKKCLTLSTRPRALYDEHGVCNACNWVEQKKKSINWNERWQQLTDLCHKYRCIDGSNWDCIVPCSGGKDGSYVATRLRDDFGMHPLCVTLKPQIQTEIGRKNLDNFIMSGFDHILITPNPKIYSRLAKKGFVEQGRPKLPFVVGISLFTMNIAMKFKIPFIMYGEEGEEEYGGAESQVGKYKIDRKYLINYYYSGHDPNEYLDDFSKDDLKWWTLPTDKELMEAKLFPTHWSHFEDWNPELHYNVARDKCGLKTIVGKSVGTFTNYSQLDDKLQDLHAYMMYIKFGFGRAWSDACIEIRAGRMTRDEGIELVKKYDGVFPYEYLQDYLEYFKMTEYEFWSVVDSFRSSDIWHLDTFNNKWRLKFEIK